MDWFGSSVLTQPPIEENWCDRLSVLRWLDGFPFGYLCEVVNHNIGPWAIPSCSSFPVLVECPKVWPLEAVRLAVFGDVYTETLWCAQSLLQIHVDGFWFHIDASVYKQLCLSLQMQFYASAHNCCCLPPWWTVTKLMKSQHRRQLLQTVKENRSEFNNPSINFLVVPLDWPCLGSLLFDPIS